jgi:aryl-alcohol dehydrogenase-like predicted oxidoreductase
MQLVRLGRTALKVSRYCLGTTNFGPRTSEAESHLILDAALDAGINFIDTADVYGYDAGRGLTEEIIGRWLAKGGGRRERIVLATKVFTDMSDAPNTGGLSAYHIRRACEASLRRLQTDHIDLYQMHHVDRHAPWDEVWQAMEQLVREGKVTYVGSSNFAAWHLAVAQESARNRHFLGLVSEQSVYNLRNRTVELEVIPAARHYGLAFIPYSPTDMGRLAGRVDSEMETGRRSTPASRAIFERQRSQYAAWEVLCHELGTAPAEVALAWLLHRPGVTAPIIGPRTMEQFRGALRALEMPLDADLLEKIEAIWPGPGGEAPEAYAW